MKTTDINKKELSDISREQGKKLGYLIYNSTLTDEIKQELLALLSEMSIEQIDKLINIFDAKLLDEDTGKIDKDFEKEIKEIRESFENDKKNLSDNFLLSVEELGKKIDL